MTRTFRQISTVCRQHENKLPVYFFSALFPLKTNVHVVSWILRGSYGNIKALQRRKHSPLGKQATLCNYMHPHKNTMWQMLDQACVCVRKKECRSTANKPNDQCVCPTRTNFNVQGCCSWFPVYDDLLLLFRHIKVNKAPASAVVSSVSCWVEAAGLCSGHSNRFGLDEQ